MKKHLMFLSAPGLRAADIGEITPHLRALHRRGAMRELTPTFPCVTSPVQANMMTGCNAEAHGVIGNGFYDRQRREVEFWVGDNSVIQRPQVWDLLRRRDPAITSAVWHAQNIKNAGADFIVTPAPIHKPDGSTELWCYSKPEGLYAQMIGDLGHFPLQHYWGPMANIKSSAWIVQAAEWLIDRHAPRFHYVYIPHLDYATQKFGPDSERAEAALAEFDALVGDFTAWVERSSIAGEVEWLICSEYALTPVVGAVHPNRLLRNAGLLEVREDGEGEVIDFERSAAVAVVDHQLAHVYAGPDRLEAVAELFRGVFGIDGIYAGAEKKAVGVDHPRSGEIVLVSAADHWFSYYWWLDDDAAPPFAHTVDIHRKPGYDPVELFWDPDKKAIPLNDVLVKGSHGAPVLSDNQKAVVLSSCPMPALEGPAVFRDTDVAAVILEYFGQVET